jgi:phosphohistidine phosphatase
MLQIWLLRHAKSDWKDGSLADHARPLNKRGRRSATEVAETVRRESIAPAVVLVSTALRATQTAEALGLTLSPEPALYNAAAPDLLGQLRALPADASSVMLVGHNPGMEDLAAQLGDRDGMSTATLIGFDLDTDSWADVGAATSKRVARYEHPGR